MGDLQTHTEVLTGVLINMAQHLEENENKVANLEANNAKCSIVLTGFYGSSQKEECMEQIHTLLTEEMGVVGVEITDLFSLGGTIPKPIVFTLANKSQKYRILQMKTSLKHLVNQEGKQMFLNEYLPAKSSKHRKRERDIVRVNDEADQVNKVEVERKAGRLYIDSEPYVKKIQTPDPAAILEQSPSQIEKLMSIQIHRGPEIPIKDSTFIGYSVPTSKIEHIQQLYLKNIGILGIHEKL